MNPVILQNDQIQATFSPFQGMNLLQFLANGLEMIDQNTRPLFLERFAGLGSLIGPHFHHRPKGEIQEVPHESLFPHIARVRAKGILEPFSHGIARYAPWKVEILDQSIQAQLSGNDVWNGSLLSSLEGFSFEMKLQASLLSNGLSLDYSIESEKPSVLGFHYYYALPSTGGTIRAQVENSYRVKDEWMPIHPSFLDKEGNLFFDALQECDFGFIPKAPFEVFYENKNFSLKISFQVDGEASFQLYRPKDASYICIEPLTAKDPKQPILKKSSLQVKIEVV